MDSEHIPTVTYFLVLLHAGPNRARSEPPWSAHVAFIDSLVELDVVLLGGDFGRPVAGAEGAYVLHASTGREKQRLGLRRTRWSSTGATCRKSSNGAWWALPLEPLIPF